MQTLYIDMENSNAVKSLLQNVVNEIHLAEKFCKAFMTKAQKIGLQGEKRRYRYESVKYHNLVNYLVCDFFDLHGSDLGATYTDVSIPTVTGISDFFVKSLSHKESLYNKLHGIANGLMPANGYNYACCLLEKCNCLATDIKEYRRIIMEGDSANWSPEYLQRLMLHQTTWVNTHDEFEDKEEEVGYKY